MSQYIFEHEGVKYYFKKDESDKDKCIVEFESCYNKEVTLIEWIKTNKIKVLNSGIKIA